MCAPVCFLVIEKYPFLTPAKRMTYPGISKMCSHTVYTITEERKNPGKAAAFGGEGRVGIVAVVKMPI